MSHVILAVTSLPILEDGAVDLSAIAESTAPKMLDRMIKPEVAR